MVSDVVCSACGGDVVHVGTYPAGPGGPMGEPDVEVGFCLACGEALRLARRGVTHAEPMLVPPPT